MDNDYAIDRFSDGEEDDIAVALRIALSRYLAELHLVHESTFLIFDEIFGSQDEGRRSNLLTALRAQESRFPRILLISHIAEMQGELANTLVIELGTDGTNRVKEVEWAAETTGTVPNYIRGVRSFYSGSKETVLRVIPG